MNCNEFKSRLADLFDQDIPAQTWAEMKQHMDNCPACRAEYEEMKMLADSLRPMHSPVSDMTDQKEEKKVVVRTPQIALRPRHKWWNMAASIAIFVVGIVVGSTHFFSESAQAAPFSFEQAIQSVRNVGSYLLKLQVRTVAHENFAHFDPKGDFMEVSMQKLSIGNNQYWRVEKEGGRTIIFDGQDQYMWVPEKLYLLGTPQSNFMEYFSLFIEPTQLFNMQQMAIKLNKNTQTSTSVSDSTLTVTTTFEVEGTELSAIFNNESSTKRVTIENVCSMPDGLLRSLRVWIDWHGEQIEIIRSTDIEYNIPIDKESLISLPTGAEWLDLRQGLTVLSDENRLSLLSNENPVDAAQRILNSLISGQTDEAREALYYYEKVLPEMFNMFKGCKVSDFTLRREKPYPGVYVFYTLTRPDGKTELNHVALRNDNEQHIWILDGGL